MASKSRKAFDDNIQDVENLVHYYEFADESFRDTKIKPPPGADIVLRSAVVMLVTYWEAYVEDIVTEGVAHLVKHASDPQKLPKELRKAIAKELKADKNDIAIWQLAGDGWRSLLTKRLPDLTKGRNRSFNTPKSGQTREFVRSALGIDNITSSWKVDSKESAESCQTLDKLVELRGKIAHRGKLSKPLRVDDITTLTEWIKQLVSKTGGNINTCLKKSCGVPLWSKPKK